MTTTQNGLSASSNQTFLDDASRWQMLVCGIRCHRYNNNKYEQVAGFSYCSLQMERYFGASPRLFFSMHHLRKMRAHAANSQPQSLAFFERFR
jgi:hypothetical protein